MKKETVVVLMVLVLFSVYTWVFHHKKTSDYSTFAEGKIEQVEILENKLMIKFLEDDQVYFVDYVVGCDVPVVGKLFLKSEASYLKSGNYVYILNCKNGTKHLSTIGDELEQGVLNMIFIYPSGLFYIVGYALMFLAYLYYVRWTNSTKYKIKKIRKEMK